MRNETHWDELADRIGKAYQDLELYIATRDLRLAEAKPLEREAISKRAPCGSGRSRMRWRR